MPRFNDPTTTLTYLEKGDLLMGGDPSQYSNILADNLFSRSMTRTALQALISANTLIVGQKYVITDAVSSTMSLLVEAVSLNDLSEIAIDTTTGINYVYSIVTDVASVKESQRLLTQVKNTTGATLTKGTIVYISGGQGNLPLVSKAIATLENSSALTYGVVSADITNNNSGFVIVIGSLEGVDTSAYTAGTTLYLSGVTAGTWTSTKPVAPIHMVYVGIVVRQHANQGAIEVKIQNGYELKELHDVQVQNPSNNNVLVYESSSSLWKDKSLGTIIGGTSSQFTKGDGSLDSNTYLTTISGISAGGELSGNYPNPNLVNSAVTGKVLTGLSVTGSAIVSTDSMLTAFGKLQNQVNALVGGVNYRGTWNASTNNPSLASGVGTQGYYYVVSVAGSTNLDGITTWELGDWAIFNGTAWQKVDNTDAVVSVNGYTGIVTLAKADIGLSNVENTALSTWAGSTNITTLGTIGTGVWNGTAIGDTYISSASTWNAKIGGSGTTNYIPKFTASGAIGSSLIYDNGNGGIGINTSTIGGNANNIVLKIEGADSANISIAEIGGASADFSSFGGTAYIGTGTAHDFYLYANSIQALRINTTGNLIASVTPTTSAGTFDLITRNTSTGVLEKVASNYYATAGSISGTTGKLAKFTSSGAVGDSIVSESASGLTASITQNNATTFIAVENTDNTAGTARASLRSISGTVTSEVLSISGFGGFIGTSSNHRVSLMMNGSEYIGINATNGRIQTNQAADTGESFIIGGSARVNGALTINGQQNFINGSSFTSANTLVQKITTYAGSTNQFEIASINFITADFVDGGIITFNTNNYATNTERMRITSGGNVLIGTTTDNGTDKLQVNGSVYSASGFKTMAGLFSSDGSGEIDFNYNNGATGGLYYFAGGTSAKFFVTSAGAGTFSNGLTVKSTGYGTIASFLDAANSGIKLVANASVGYNEIISDGNQPFLITVNSAERFRIAGNGAATFSSSVSMGALTVRGSGNSIVDAANTFAVSIGAASATPNFVAIGTSGSGVPQIQGYNNAFSSTTPLALQPNGSNVLIATTTDNGVDKLQVNGSIAIGNTVTASASTPSTHKVTINIGGTTYYLLATT